MLKKLLPEGLLNRPTQMLIKILRPFRLLIALSPIQVQDGATYAAWPSDGGTPAAWPSDGGTPAAWRYAGPNQINRSNVDNLLPARVFQAGDYAKNLQCTPTVVDGVTYLSTPRIRVFALKADTGELMWEYR